MRKNILWVLEDNIYKDYGYVRFVEMLQRMGEKVTFVKPVPFTNILLPQGFIKPEDRDINESDGIKIESEDPVVCFGSMGLRRIAIAQGLKPGKFGSGIFHYSDWKEGFGAENILNPDSIIGRVQDFKGYVPEESVFVRPTKDDKALSGTVMDPQAFADWIEKYSGVDPDPMIVAMLNRITEILIAPTKQIYSEARFFVVDGKVVAGSMYKRGTMVKPDANVDQAIWRFAQSMVYQYCPEDAFVMDIAETPDGFKVIELNDFNCSGFYACDVQYIIEAVIKLVNWGPTHRKRPLGNGLVLI